ncbi:hypothetical protein LTR97_004407 [Elasticomyces elasticus]|uniref:DUF431-domain-containing protein n=1 Tax=Elasticomyces elasticus TaxID=574655 RepID=A0AAN8A3A3_9PEZI|nr:hypothetical protein LTR97_004407 [Elasticomyces elasticus]KAK5724789.1 hypothetical protein LTR15_004838 [Elasticomyces elasticus]
MAKRHTFIVEHLDPELEEWQALEYKCIHRECEASGANFILSGVANASHVQKQLGLSSTVVQQKGIEDLYSTPEARQKVCLLDPKGERDINPEDGDVFDVFLFGGILGDEPPRDRTGELRNKGFAGRRLGPEQMTTDTAARVTRIVVQEKKRLDEIDFVDRPDIELPGTANGDGPGHPNESVSMPFKYVKGADGKPMMPEGMVKLLVEDMDKGIEDLL